MLIKIFIKLYAILGTCVLTVIDLGPHVLVCSLYCLEFSE